mgnify:CR=1 FL=1
MLVGCKRAYIDADFNLGETFRPEECVSIPQMVQALTEGGYYSIGIADRAGKLLEGMDADLVVLSDNILEFDDAYKLLDVAVEMTVSEGDIVFEGPLTLREGLEKSGVLLV